MDPKATRDVSCITLCGRFLQRSGTLASLSGVIGARATARVDKNVICL